MKKLEEVLAEMETIVEPLVMSQFLNREALHKALRDRAEEFEIQNRRLLAALREAIQQRDDLNVNEYGERRLQNFELKDEMNAKLAAILTGEVKE